MTVLLEYFDGPVYALLEGMILLSLSVNFFTYSKSNHIILDTAYKTLFPNFYTASY